MKGRIFLLLFALPFFGVGVWMTWSVGSNLHDAWRMNSWEPVQAELVKGGYHTHSDSDSTTYEAYAEYRYTIGGRSFVGTRVGVAGGADNIGDHQQHVGRSLQRALAAGANVTVYVDPNDPDSAIYDRSLRWGLLGLKTIFLLTFGGVGLALIIVAIKAPAPKDLTDPIYQDSPWLANENWQGDPIRSDSRGTMYAAWGFAALWNLISAPLPFLLYGEIVDKQNWPALIGLLFPLIGAGLIVWAVRRTREWRRFGAAPLTLDPFPGAIGGDVAGTIDIDLPYDADQRFTVTLTCIRSYQSGSGKNKSRSQSAEWQESQVAHSEFQSRGTRVSFRFDVPDHLSGSDAEQANDTYYFWRLNIEAELTGTDLDRDYEIPVYPTGKRSRTLARLSLDAARFEQSHMDDAAIRDTVRINKSPHGTTIVFPMGRRLSTSVIMSLIGTLFAGIGVFVIADADQTFLGGVFALVGSLVLLGGLYMLLNSLEVAREGDRITSTRKLLGFPVSRSNLAAHTVTRLKESETSKSQSGGKHTIYYALDAVDRSGNKVRVGEGFEGTNQVRAARTFIATELGLAAAREASAPEPTTPDDASADTSLDDYLEI